MASEQNFRAYIFFSSQNPIDSFQCLFLFSLVLQPCSCGRPRVISMCVIGGDDTVTVGMLLPLQRVDVIDRKMS